MGNRKTKLNTKLNWSPSLKHFPGFQWDCWWLAIMALKDPGKRMSCDSYLLCLDHMH
jgi:hypothetical protein